MAEAQDFKWYDVQLLRTASKGKRRKVILSTGAELSFDGRKGSKTARQSVRMPSADAGKLAQSGDFSVKERKAPPADKPSKPVAEMNAFERRMHEKAVREKGAAEEAAAAPKDEDPEPDGEPQIGPISNEPVEV